MSASDSHPMADWPPDLLRLSNKFALSGEVDGQHPPDSMIEAYLLVAEVRTKRLSGIPWGDGTHDLADDEEALLADLTPARATCARCGALVFESAAVPSFAAL